ncbi:DUF4224 domain-containing protein [Paraburkholderia sp. WP4_3_2]|uniref:DUF4224 domain-containing protein n=1 Tax=Paraburkholderia sp. WP4_3_2 TaxID=2587162 RepID=UPI0017E8F07D|nr:DUF4224 domain-containing protein [Paraburkholderia sp. WP4_3_2]MBB3256912.1 hypothetical protein [Paraburkholderia sp. WP4_3_2]
MTAEDLARVTGKKRYGKQVEWFKAQFGINVARCGDGSPVVTWATFEALQAKKAGVASAPIKEDRPALIPLRAVK